MNITDVRIRKVNDEGKMKAVVSITFDDEFVVHDIKISEISHILLFQIQEIKSGMLFSKNTKRFLLRRLQKLKRKLRWRKYRQKTDMLLRTASLS